MKRLKNIIKSRESSLFFINIALIVFLSLMFKNFTHPGNIFGLLHFISIYSIIAGAMTVLFVSGGFDISAGVMLGLAGALMGRLLVGYGLSIPFALIITIASGIAIGSLIGYIVAYLNINPFFVTLAAYFIIKSFVFIVSGKKDIVGFPQSYGLIANYQILKVPTIIIFSFISLIIFEILLRKNVYFRQNFAIGGNEDGAMLAGIKVKKVKMLNYTLVSTMSAVSGIFITSRYMAAYTKTGSEAAFQIITAVIIGGASLKGGKGSVLGTFLGLVLIALIYNSFVFLKMNVLWKDVAMGFILILVVLIDILFNKEGKSSFRKI